MPHAIRNDRRAARKARRPVPSAARRQNASRDIIPLRAPLQRFASAKTYRFLRYYPSVVQGTDGTNETFAAYYHTLDGLEDYNDFTALFDQYRIVEIGVRATPAMNTETLAAGGAGFNSQLLTYVDFDDNTTPTASDMLQRQNLQNWDWSRPFSFRYQPRVANALFSGAFTSYGNTSPWIDVASPSVRYYGWKLGITPACSQLYNLNLLTYAIVEFRTAR